MVQRGYRSSISVLLDRPLSFWNRGLAGYVGTALAERLSHRVSLRVDGIL